MLLQIISKLTSSRIIKNRHVYLPYIGSVIGTIAIFFSVDNLRYYETLQANPYFGYLSVMLVLGLTVTIIFSAIFLLYTSSFLLKTQKKELALYGVLGMEQKHLRYMMVFENFIIYAVGMIIGIILGWLSSYVLYLGFSNFMHLEQESSIIFSLASVRLTSVLFGIIFLLILFSSIRSVSKINLAQMLQESEAGEKKVRFALLKGIAGIACIGLGYYMSFSTKNAIAAILLFFVAVLFVIVGTYLFFTSTISLVLRAMKKNTKLYYRKNNFIVISNLLQRVRKNAAGLATICILGTMLMVALSTTVSWFVAIPNTINGVYPYDLEFPTNEKKESEAMQKQVSDIANQTNVELVHNVVYEWETLMPGVIEDGKLKIPDVEMVISPIIFTDIKEYNQIQKEDTQLKENEIKIYNPNNMSNEELQIGSTSYQIEEYIPQAIINEYYSVEQQTVKPIIIITKDKQQRDNIKDAVFKESDIATFSGQYNFVADVRGPEKNKKAFYQTINHQETSGLLAGLNIKSTTIEDFLQQIGMILFVGVLLSVLFLIATALVIYYKQLTEGDEDAKQFNIMEKVGMTTKEIKQTTSRQLLLLFFLPLLVAVCHSFAALPMLAILSNGVLNVPIILSLKITTIVTVSFIIIYIVIYHLTSSAYYGSMKKNKY